ncbi:nitrogenase molybdenum-iron protein alpha/beta subunit [Hydrogenispora ethanolica]|uniref:Nitrogenase molybdenum-iron protein alpha/beta subunit n=1 Tax=Hydrogenispora ethanolica TaxID=1082276 RepID=A0A4R1R5S8_HYDET|nr:nitrogenase component 1 [Hydrogenispora ethanolica]TCL60883.1 nitrogenase molybdenum-iron protein alpha/beta subunit [Hydrogenispora ethanolica]
MSEEFLRMSLAEAGRSDSLLRGKRLFEHCLQYTSPSHGGWGIVRVGMLVPQSVMLFIAPPACGRHGAIAGFQQGFKQRLFYLYVDEVDLVTGGHLDLVARAVAEIFATAKPRPQALIICISCVDYLLGSDFDSIVRELEADFEIPVRLSYMNPIAMDSRTPPQPNMQKTVYSFMPQPPEKDNGINIIGNFVPVEKHSELYELLGRAGFGPVRQIGQCATLAELEKMSRSAHNLLIRAEGRLAAAFLRDKLGIPFCFTPVVYGLEAIAKGYQDMAEFLGCRLETECYRREAVDAIAAARARLGPLKLAVCSTANAMPFELSRALTEFGFEVAYIFCDEMMDADAEHLEWLVQNSPATQVLTNVHPGMPVFAAGRNEVDLAIGLSAGYYCNCPRTVPLTMDCQPYGYRGIVYLLNAMIAAWEEPPRDLQDVILNATIVI